MRHASFRVLGKARLISRTFLDQSQQRTDPAIPPNDIQHNPKRTRMLQDSTCGEAQTTHIGCDDKFLLGTGPQGQDPTSRCLQPQTRRRRQAQQREAFNQRVHKISAKQPFGQRVEVENACEAVSVNRKVLCVKVTMQHAQPMPRERASFHRNVQKPRKPVGEDRMTVGIVRQHGIQPLRRP